MSAAIETANESRISIEAGGLLIDGQKIGISRDPYAPSGIDFDVFPHDEVIIEGQAGNKSIGSVYSASPDSSVLLSVIKCALKNDHKVTSSAEYLSVDTDSESIRNKSQTLFKKIGPFVVGVSEINSTWIMNGYDDKPRNSFSYKTLSIGRFGLKRALGINKV